MGAAAASGLRHTDVRRLAAAEACSTHGARRGCCSATLSSLLAVHCAMRQAGLACCGSVCDDMQHQRWWREGARQGGGCCRQPSMRAARMRMHDCQGRPGCRGRPGAVVFGD